MTQEISAIHTPCKNCVFAQYNNITQTGCFLGYLDRYKNMGTEILEVYDQEKEFYVLNDKKCIGYRENKWFTQFGLDRASIEAKIKKYLDNEYIRYMVVINLREMNLGILENICRGLSTAPVKPQKIIIIRYLDNREFKYADIEKCLKKTNVGCAWRVQTILDNEAPYEGIIINDILRNNKNQRFLLHINKDNNSISQIVDFANNTVYRDLGTLICCGNNDRSCLLYSSTAYRFAIENHKNLIEDKEIFIEL